MAPDGRGRNGHNGRPESLPPDWLAGWFDPELEQLFSGEPELKHTAQLLHAARPEAEPDPHFRTRLRASLAAEAHRAQSRRRRWFFGPVHLAWTGAGVGAVAIAATVLTLFNGPPADHQTLVALSNVAAQHSVSPNDVITVAFNQPMDQRAVVSGLHIQPATEVRTAWRGNNLQITPLHHLTGNTPYTVTIDRRAARTASGTIAAAPIQITFGTAPTPPRTTAARPPAMVMATLGQATPGARVLFAPDGTVIVTSSAPPQSATPASPEASGSPGASPLPSSAAAGVAPVMIAYPQTGAPVILGPAATEAALSPNGTLLAVAVPDANGTVSVIVTDPAGRSPATLVQGQPEVTSLAWASNRSVVYATSAGAIRSVDLTGVSRTLSEPSNVGAVELSPDGKFAYLAPQSGVGGELLNIAGGERQALAGSGRGVAFSADSSTVAWVDQSQAPAHLQTQSVGTKTQVTVSLLDASTTVSTIALNRRGTEIAYVEQAASGSATTVIAQLPSGAPIAVGPGASSLAFADDGQSLALINPTTSPAALQRAAVPGATLSTQSAGLSSAAARALQAFIDAQVRRDTDTLTSLSTVGAGAVATTPRGLSRGYVVSAATNTDGTITATAELIVDANTTQPLPQKADETLTLAKGTDGASYLVISVAAGQLHDDPPGPHVIGVTTSAQHGSVAVQINFDSDLDKSTVPSAISAVDSDGTPLIAAVLYNEETRSATLTLSRVPVGPITVSIGVSLRDVDAQSLASAFSARAGI